jgi:hypothetical protein
MLLAHVAVVTWLQPVQVSTSAVESMAAPRVVSFVPVSLYLICPLSGYVVVATPDSGVLHPAHVMRLPVVIGDPDVTL